MKRRPMIATSSSQPARSRRLRTAWPASGLISLALIAAGCGSDLPPVGTDSGLGDGAVSDSGPADTGMHCTPRTCEAAGANCGPIADGCGGLIECGECTAVGAVCGGGGQPNVCGGGIQNCTPKTCEELNANCGPIADGCGRLIDCGSCTMDGESCGGGGLHNRCGSPEGNPEECPALLTCDDVGAQCGLVSNGCGGVLDCGGCDEAGESCGGGGTHNRCGAPTCTRLTCDDVDPEHCGPVGDGCGGVLTDCGVTCQEPETCGGGGVYDRCGEGGWTCQPLELSVVCPAGACGPASDGCGGQIDCGGCTGGLICGGGSQAGVCGAPVCVARTCGQLNADCGEIPDGCGGTLQCGTCSVAGQTCGGSGVPNQCGAPSCTPLTCQEQGIGCGLAGDGCGGQLDCGGCTNGDSCGGGGVASQCGRPSCTPQTCQDVGANCGPIGDGCGGVIASCGNCSGGNICGGGGTPSVCGGAPTGGPGGPGCTGLCENQVYCPNNGATTLTGVVYAPNGTIPLYNAIVYVPVDPNAPLPAITDGASCDRCTDEDLGEPLVSALTNSDGSFTLRHVPAGVSFPLVIKKGKWRRVVTIPARTGCSSTALTSEQTRLPRNRNEGHIPFIGITTGRVDGLECVLYKAGVDAAEFTRPTGNGRIRMYRGSIDRSSNGRGGSWPDAASRQCQMCGTGNTGGEQNCRTTWCGGAANSFRTDTLNSIHAQRLYESQAPLDAYDMVIFGCEASETGRAAADRARLLQHVNVGGRLFLSHFHYDWIYRGGSNGYTTAPLHTTAVWNNGGGTGNLSDPTAAIVDSTFPRGQAFREWLDFTNSSHPTQGSGFVQIDEPRRYVQSTTALGRRWVYTTQAAHGENSIQQFTFNTPVGAPEEDICGRVVYSAFHVTVGSTWDSVFPNHCGGDLTAQEKTLLFMLFDLASCVADDNVPPPPPPSCDAQSCQDVNAECGVVADGCGSAVDCGPCPNGDVCVNNQCVPSGCTPRTCVEASANCGTVADGCGGTLDCGPCVPGLVCGAAAPNQCGVPPCVPRTCDDVGANCGVLADGCGGTDDCGLCPNPGETCGASGVPNVCGTGQCSPRSCADVNAECGQIGDGCGAAVDCGPCPPDQVCGGAGPNRCGVPSCPPATCDQVGAECGLIGDGCGGSVDCGPCTGPGQLCGAGGPNLCGTGCQPLTCESQNAECGQIGDGCGNAVDCGPCPPGLVCGGGGVPNRCGEGPVCTPATCQSASAQCGLIGDGCGASINCGECPDGTTCGGSGIPNVCGGTCTANRTCADYNAECGQVSDGCGGLVDCGVCAPGLVCGLLAPNQCSAF